jgi:hypothetical protein
VSGAEWLQQSLFSGKPVLPPPLSCRLPHSLSLAQWPADSDLEEAKLMAFQSMDAPVSPGRKGQSLLTTGITNAMKQAR